MNDTPPKNDLASTLRQAMGPGFAFNSVAAMERLAARPQTHTAERRVQSGNVIA